MAPSRYSILYSALLLTATIADTCDKWYDRAQRSQVSEANVPVTFKTASNVRAVHNTRTAATGGEYEAGE
jgi:hypothetical protein